MLKWKGGYLRLSNVREQIIVKARSNADNLFIPVFLLVTGEDSVVVVGGGGAQLVGFGCPNWTEEGSGSGSEEDTMMMMSFQSNG